MSLTADYFGEEELQQASRTLHQRACQTVLDTVKKNLGNGLVNSKSKIPIDTSLGKIILKDEDAKVFLELAKLQHREVGDGMTSVVIVAAELLKRAETLKRNNNELSSIVSGYKLAMSKACKFIEKLMTKVEKLDKDLLVNYAKTSMSSKNKNILGDINIDIFTKLMVEALLLVKMTNWQKEIKYPIECISFLKGESVGDSFLNDGWYGLNTRLTNRREPLTVLSAKIACIDMPRSSLHVMTAEDIAKLIRKRTTVILTTNEISDMSFTYLGDSSVSVIAVSNVPKEDMQNVAKATGATLITTSDDLEKFGHEDLGSAEKVYEQRLENDAFVWIAGTKVVSLILSGATDKTRYVIMEQAHMVKRILESKTVVEGGGAVETALSVYLRQLARIWECPIIVEFADALLTIPKVLAENAGKNATLLVNQLEAHYHTQQTNAADYLSMGFDLANGNIRNNFEAGVIEPAMSKVKIIQLATTAAVENLHLFI